MGSLTVEVSNDAFVEYNWLTLAMKQADDYMSQLYGGGSSTTTTTRPLTGKQETDDVIYKAFRRVFPTLNIDRLDPYDPVGPYLDREFWKPLLQSHQDLVHDPTMLTILRPDASQPHSSDNAMLVPRLKFLCIEIARMREGVNDCIIASGAIRKDKDDDECDRGAITSTGTSTSTQGNHKQAASAVVVVLTKTLRFWSIDVTTTTSSSTGDGGDVHEEGKGIDHVLEALGGDGDESLREAVREEIDRQMASLHHAQEVNRLAVEEQARQAMPPAAYKDHAMGVVHPSHVSSLKVQGMVVIDGALSPQTIQQARQQAEELKQKGMLKPTPQRDTQVRYDVIRWLHEDDLLGAGEALRQALLMLKGIAYQVEEAMGVGPLVVPHQCMLAYYGPGGAHYVAHRDNNPIVNGGGKRSAGTATTANSTTTMANDREVTALLYLNDTDWDVDRDGGCLRCYMGADPDDEEGTTATQVRDVAPIGGRLIIFRSRDLLHEVLPTHEKGRWALSIWILGGKAAANEA